MLFIISFGAFATSAPFSTAAAIKVPGDYANPANDTVPKPRDRGGQGESDPEMLHGSWLLHPNLGRVISNFDSSRVLAHESLSKIGLCRGSCK